MRHRNKRADLMSNVIKRNLHGAGTAMGGSIAGQVPPRVPKGCEPVDRPKFTRIPAKVLSKVLLVRVASVAYRRGIRRSRRSCSSSTPSPRTCPLTSFICFKCKRSRLDLDSSPCRGIHPTCTECAAKDRVTVSVRLVWTLARTYGFRPGYFCDSHRDCGCWFGIHLGACPVANPFWCSVCSKVRAVVPGSYWGDPGYLSAIMKHYYPLREFDFHFRYSGIDRLGDFHTGTLTSAGAEYHLPILDSLISKVPFRRVLSKAGLAEPSGMLPSSESGLRLIFPSSSKKLSAELLSAFGTSFFLMAVRPSLPSALVSAIGIASLTRRGARILPLLVPWQVSVSDSMFSRPPSPTVGPLEADPPEATPGPVALAPIPGDPLALITARQLRRSQGIHVPGPFVWKDRSRDPASAVFQRVGSVLSSMVTDGLNSDALSPPDHIYFSSDLAEIVGWLYSLSPPIDMGVFMDRYRLRYRRL